MLWVVAEVLFPIAWELPLDLGLQAAGEAFDRRSRSHPVVAGICIAVMGCIAGVMASLLWPSRIFGVSPVPGASLVLSPLVTGILMEAYGRWRASRGGHPSHAATFWGGALFAYGCALVRFVLVTR